MKKYIYALISVVLAVSVAYGAGGYNTAVYHERDGDRVVVASGGSIDVESGGEVDVESGGSFKLAGTAVTATASELSQVDDSLASTDGIKIKKTLRMSLDCNASACTSGSTLLLGQVLPANALVTQVYYEISQQFSGATGTIAFECEDTSNLVIPVILAAAAVDTVSAGVAIGTAVTMVNGIAAQCNVSAVFGIEDSVSGALSLFTDYVVHN